MADGQRCSACFVKNYWCKKYSPSFNVCSRLYMYIIQIYTQHSIMSHKNNGRLKNETKEKACLFNRPSQHDSALISRPYMTSIATATRRPPTPLTSSTIDLEWDVIVNGSFVLKYKLGECHDIVYTLCYTYLVTKTISCTFQNKIKRF